MKKMLKSAKTLDVIIGSGGRKNRLIVNMRSGSVELFLTPDAILDLLTSCTEVISTIGKRVGLQQAVVGVEYDSGQVPSTMPGMKVRLRRKAWSVIEITDDGINVGLTTKVFLRRLTRYFKNTKVLYVGGRLDELQGVINALNIEKVKKTI